MNFSLTCLTKFKVWDNSQKLFSLYSKNILKLPITMVGYFWKISLVAVFSVKYTVSPFYNTINLKSTA